MSEDKKDIEKIYEKKAMEGAAAEVVQRYGSAVKEHFVAYSGSDNEADRKLTKSLKSISKSKVNPNYKKQNIKQQAGFSAEVKTTAKRNAENIINKDSTRVVRTDDLGRVNDELYDLIFIDENGNPIKGTGSQMKFVGRSSDELLDKLNSKKFQKYLDKDTLLDIADDDYDALMGANGTKGIIDNRIDKLKKQVESAEQKGNMDLAAQKNAQIEKYEKIKKNLRKTGVSRKEALFARNHPRLSTAKDVVGISHQAGKEQAKYGAAISGSVSLVKNVVACIKGDKSPKDAAIDVAQTTGEGAVVSYATAFSGSMIKGALQNSTHQMARNLSKTNFASGLITTTLDVGRTMKCYIKGEITGAECVETLGEHGVGEIGAAMFSSIGLASVAGAASPLVHIIAGMTGATLGYAAATAVYKELATSLKEYELAKEERIRVEAECKEAITLIRQYREEMNQLVEQYLTKNIQTFDEGFKAMDRAIIENDINGFIRGNVEIQELLGREVQYKNQDEFDELMLSDVKFKL